MGTEVRLISWIAPIMIITDPETDQTTTVRKGGSTLAMAQSHSQSGVGNHSFSMKGVYMNAINFLAKFGAEHNLRFITDKIKFNNQQSYNFKLINVPYHTNPYPVNTYSDHEIKILIAICQDFLRHLARDSHDPILIELGSVLHCIMSQDYATKEIGFDIQEHLDYFTKFIDDEAEKNKLAEDLIADW